MQKVNRSMQSLLDEAGVTLEPSGSVSHVSTQIGTPALPSISAPSTSAATGPNKRQRLNLSYKSETATQRLSQLPQETKLKREAIGSSSQDPKPRKRALSTALTDKTNVSRGIPTSDRMQHLNAERHKLIAINNRNHSVLKGLKFRPDVKTESSVACLETTAILVKPEPSSPRSAHKRKKPDSCECWF